MAYYDRGVARYEREDYDRAIQDFEQTIKLDGKNAAAFYNRGIAYHEKRDYDRAIEDFQSGDQARSQARRGVQRARQCAGEQGRLRQGDRAT